MVLKEEGTLETHGNGDNQYAVMTLLATVAVERRRRKFIRRLIKNNFKYKVLSTKLQLLYTRITSIFFFIPIPHHILNISTWELNTV